MVSPVYKGGYGVHQITGVSTDGEGVALSDPGSFEGAPASGTENFTNSGSYLARRGSSGWSTVPIMAPATLSAETDAGDLTPELSQVLTIGHPGANTTSPLLAQDLLVHSLDVPDTSAGWEQLGALEPLNEVTATGFNPAYRAASLEFCHILFSPSEGAFLVPEAVGATEELYEFSRGCGSESKSLRLVGLDNQGNLIQSVCQTNIGAEKYVASGGSAFNAVSGDGSEVFFTVCTKTSGNTRYGPELPHQVFVRLGGSRTVEVSRPLQAGSPFGGCVGEGAGKVAGEVPCEGAAARGSADFEGASEDGSRVYFTAPLAAGQQPLVAGDTDASNNLYLASIGCPAGKPGCGASEREVTGLSEVSHDPLSGQSADVRGVVRVAPDGSRVYFVAGGVLTGTPGPEGRTALAGAENLYVYDADSGTVAFIGDLCSGKELSGTVEDVHCPNATKTDESLWADNEGEAQTAGADGRFLVFASYAQLSGSDTNAAKDVYRYDAETGGLDRVSGGEGGSDDNGNSPVLSESGEPLGASIAPGHYGGSLREQHEMSNRAVSEDGSRIVFTSAEPLSPDASNGLENVYEWHESASGGEGSVSLISGGNAEELVNYEHVVISPSGQDIFFVTSQGLVSQDTDGEGDVYDARLGAGFPQTPASVAPCSGDACQGPLTNPAPLLVPGSVSQGAGENLSPPAPVPVVTPKKVAPKCAKGKKLSRGRCVKDKIKKKAKRAKRSSNERRAGR
jgi:hypothetical protein